LAELKAAIGPLSGRRLKYCTDPCLRRYLEARNWNVDKAKKMLEESFKWRSTYKPEEIRWVSLIYLALPFTCSIDDAEIYNLVQDISLYSILYLVSCLEKYILGLYSKSIFKHPN
jgi:hypothetical protein